MKWWTGIPLWGRVMAGLALGVAAGLGLRFGLGPESAGSLADAWARPFGDAFVNLIRMLIVPLIFTTLVSGVTAMGDLRKLGPLGGRAVGLYLVTTAIAVTLGMLAGALVQPGAGIDYQAANADAVAAIEGRLEGARETDRGVVGMLLAIIPTNPVQAFANGDVLAIIFFAILFGVGIISVGERARPVGAAIESAADVMIRLTEWIMQLAPFGVFALMTWVLAREGLGVLENLALLALALYGACLVQMALVYGGIIKLVLRLPVIRFFRGMTDAMAVAYSTSSSNATLPVTMACATDNLGVRKSVAGSILPLGATINMDGTAIYLGIVAVFAAQAIGMELSLGQYVMVGLTATLASIGTAGIPSASLFLAAAVLGSIGISEEQAILVVAFIFPFDRLLDMMRTVTNVTGDAAVSVAVAKWEGELDEAIFRAPARV